MATLESLLLYDREHDKFAGSSPDEKMFLWAMLHMAKFPKILEIGVNRGHLTVWFACAQKAHEGHVVSVDNWCMQHGGNSKSSIPAKKRLNDNRLGKYVTFFDADSKDFLAEQEKGAFDFIWIDGDHSYEGALADLELALALEPKLIGVHDVAQTYSGPRNACRTIEETYGKQGTWIMGKRGIWLYTV